MGRSPGGGNGKPTPVFLPREFWNRSLAGYNQWGRKELDTTERLTHLESNKGAAKILAGPRPESFLPRPLTGDLSQGSLSCLRREPGAPEPVCRGVCSEKQVPGPLPACSPSAQPHRHLHVLTGGLLCAPCSPTETSGPRPRSPSPAQMQDPSPHHTHNGLLLCAPGQGPHLGQTLTHPEPPPLLAEPPPRPDSCSPSGSSRPGQAGTLAEPLGHVPRSSLGSTSLPTLPATVLPLVWGSEC